MTERNTFLVSTHLLLIKGDEILMYQRKGGAQDGKYNVIAGHLDGGEDPRDATVREAMEEAGITIDKNDLKFSHVSYSLTGKGVEMIQFFFSCNIWKGDIQNLELDRCYEMRFFKLDSLPENTTVYIRKAIHDYQNQVRYNEYL